MADETVRVKGLKELSRAFSDLDKGVRKELQAELRELAAPVAAEAQRLAARFGAKTAAGIRPGSRLGVAYVRQSQRKTTGAHPEFGALQMRSAFEPALASHEAEIVKGVEQMLDGLVKKYGF